MTNAPADVARLRQHLVAGIPRYERRRRATRGALAGAVALVVAAAVVSAIVVDADAPRRVATGTGRPATTTPTPTPTLPIGSGRMELGYGGGDAPAALFLSNGNGFDVGLADLDAGRTVVFLDEESAFGRGAVSGAAITDSGLLIAWQTGRSTLAVDVTGTDPARSLTPDELRVVGAPAGERRVVVTADGSHAWIRYGFGEPANGSLDFVDLPTGTVLASVQAAPNARIGLPVVLVGTIGDRAILESEAWIMLVTPSGVWSIVEGPGTFVAASDDRILWSSPTGELVVTDAEGTTLHTLRSPVPGARWYPAGRVTIPSNSPPSRAFSRDGSRALLTLGGPGQEDSTTVLVDLDAGTIRNLPGDPPMMAFWARDDSRVVMVDGPLYDATLRELDPATGETFAFEAGAIPDGFFVLAAG